VVPAPVSHPERQSTDRRNRGASVCKSRITVRVIKGMPDIEKYVNDEITRQTDFQRRMFRETMAVPHGRMQTGPDQAAFLSFLVKLIGAKRAIEVGVFRGFGSYAIATALPADGKLIACDVSELPGVLRAVSETRARGRLDRVRQRSMGRHRGR
jgi:predicted O-methyltransferase YrrM